MQAALSVPVRFLYVLPSPETFYLFMAPHMKRLTEPSNFSKTVNSLLTHLFFIISFIAMPFGLFIHYQRHRLTLLKRISQSMKPLKLLTSNRFTAYLLRDDPESLAWICHSSFSTTRAPTYVFRKSKGMRRLRDFCGLLSQ